MRDTSNDLEIPLKIRMKCHFPELNINMWLVVSSLVPKPVIMSRSPSAFLSRCRMWNLNRVGDIRNSRNYSNDMNKHSKFSFHG